VRKAELSASATAIACQCGGSLLTRVVRYKKPKLAAPAKMRGIFGSLAHLSIHILQLPSPRVKATQQVREFATQPFDYFDL